NRWWSNERLVEITELSCLELAVDLGARGVDRLRMSNALLFTAGQAHHRKLRQTVFTLHQDIEILEGLEVAEHHIGAYRQHFFPVLFPRRSDRRCHQTEISSLVIGADVKLIAQMVGVVFNVLLPRRDQLPFARRG